MKFNHMIVQNPDNSNLLLPILVTVTSECSVKGFICKTWTGTLANSADPDQTPQYATSDQGLHCLLKLQEVKVNLQFEVPV